MDIALEIVDVVGIVEEGRVVFSRSIVLIGIAAAVAVIGGLMD